jgi:hypothetical protein
MCAMTLSVDGRRSSRKLRPLSLAGVAIAATVLVGCSSSGGHQTVAAPNSSTTASTAAPPTTSTTSKAQAVAAFVRAAAAQRRADRAEIMAMWRADNDAWNESRTAGINADIADSWPPSRGVSAMTFAQCDRFLNSELWGNYVIDASSIQPQPGWVDPDTKTVPEGRIYIMTAQYSSRYGAAVQPTQTQEVHAVVAPDGHAYNFSACHS